MQLSFDFSGPTPVLQRRVTADSNDYHHVPATEKQLAFARRIALRLKQDIPSTALEDRRALSAWIDRHKSDVAPAPRDAFANYPSSKQVAFAERIARMKRRSVPPECFKDRQLMSRWIDGNR